MAAHEIAVALLGDEVHRRGRAFLPLADGGEEGGGAEPALGLADEQHRLARAQVMDVGLPAGRREEAADFRGGRNAAHDR